MISRRTASSRFLTLLFALVVAMASSPAVVINSVHYHGVPPQERLDRAIRSELRRLSR